MGNLWDFSQTSDPVVSTKAYEACYLKHPALVLPVGGKVYEIYGGRSSHPIGGLDIYVGLDGFMADGVAEPWDGGIEYAYRIKDMGVPEDPVRFKKMITWLVASLKDGKRIHVGCMGGHGRTGLVLSAVAAELMGEPNAIQYVRKHYCPKAVETKAQVQFLMQHFGVSEVPGTKSYVAPVKRKGKKGGTGGVVEDFDLPWFGENFEPYSETSGGASYGGVSKAIAPAKSAKDIWTAPKSVVAD